MKWITHAIVALVALAVLSWLQYGRMIWRLQKAASSNWWKLLTLLSLDNDWQESDEPIKDGVRIVVDDKLSGLFFPHWVKYNGGHTFNRAVRLLLDKFYRKA